MHLDALTSRAALMIQRQDGGSHVVCSRLSKKLIVTKYASSSWRAVAAMAIRKYVKCRGTSGQDGS